MPCSVHYGPLDDEGGSRLDLLICQRDSRCNGPGSVLFGRHKAAAAAPWAKAVQCWPLRPFLEAARGQLCADGLSIVSDLWV